LTDEQRSQFKAAVRGFVEDLPTGGFRASLGVKPYRSMRAVFELRWAADGRALWMYGAPIDGAGRHVIWLRVGTHDIY
jgi:hypothetical protein